MKAYTYSDVLIRPDLSSVRSRSDVNIDSYLTGSNDGFKLSLPVLSANMKTVTSSSMAKAMADAGGVGIIHRDFKNDVERVNAIHYASDNGKRRVGVAVSIHDRDDFILQCANIGVTIFCVDVAHAHNTNVAKFVERVKKLLDEKYPNLVIAGNVATGEGLKFLANAGADTVKVGIGPGANCVTRLRTGVGVPQLYALQECDAFNQELNNPVGIIADGGIKEVGDIPKALKYSNCVMVGSMLAGTEESPGSPIRDENGQLYKLYSGSASSAIKGDSASYIEGITTKIPYKGSCVPILESIIHGVQSACSYVGAHNLEEFKYKCKFIEISSGARNESKL